MEKYCIFSTNIVRHVRGRKLEKEILNESYIRFMYEKKYEDKVFVNHGLRGLADFNFSNFARIMPVWQTLIMVEILDIKFNNIFFINKVSEDTRA